MSTSNHPVTLAGKIHHKAAEDIFNLVDIIFRSASSLDRLIDDLRSSSPEMEKLIQEKQAQNAFTTNVDRLKNHLQPFLQMIICRLVDNFLTFLSEILREVIRSKPELLRSEKQVRLDYVLQFNSLSELIIDLADRQVTDLGYKGFAELEKWCNEKLKIQLVIEDQTRSDLIELIETRNVVVHNRGKIGAKYCRTVIAPKFAEGEQRIVDVNYLIHALTILGSCALTLDERLAAKYSLSGSGNTLQESA